MKILIVHHVEPMWAQSFDLPHDVYVDKIVEHIQEESYDKVIMTTLEGGAYHWLEQHCDDHQWWSYAWEDPENDPEVYTDNDIDPEDIIQASGHEFTYLYPWIKDLVGADVSVCGGFDTSALLIYRTPSSIWRFL